MCQYCEGDERGCKTPSCADSGGSCACQLSGNPRCPSCGHVCWEWHYGLGLFNAPALVGGFLGGEGEEGGRFDSYPTNRSQILAKYQEFCSEQAADDPDAGYSPNDIRWLSDHLPEGTYKDPGEVFAALLPAVDGSLLDGSEWSHSLNIQAMAAGTRLVVPPEVVAFLVGREGQALDAFLPGQYTLSGETAPLAAGVSRKPVTPQQRWALDARPVFVSTRDQNARAESSGRSKSGTQTSLLATVRFCVADPAKLARSVAGKTLGRSSKPDQTIAPIVTPILQAAIESQEPQSLSSNVKGVETQARSSLEQAGLTVRSISIQAYGPSMGMAGMGPMNQEMLNRMPPEVRAMMEARMNEAMQRHAAAQAQGGAPPRPMSPPPGPASSRGAPTQGASPTFCPSCRSPNPPSVKFCQNCGTPLGAPRACPSCGKPAAPGIKFCGSCGAKLP